MRSASRSVALLVDPTPAPLTVQVAPLPNASVGAPYFAQLYTKGGKDPITWHITAGSLPAGLTLGSGEVHNLVGMNTGPQNGPTFANFEQSWPIFGPICYYKFFPASTGKLRLWTGSSRGLFADICTAYPDVIPGLCWYTTMSQQEINDHVDSIPAGITDVAFMGDNEAENGDLLHGADYVRWQNGEDYCNWYVDQAEKIRNAQARRPDVRLHLWTSHAGSWYHSDAAGGSGYGDQYLPPPSHVEMYTVDFYDRDGVSNSHWLGGMTGVLDSPGWRLWCKYALARGRPFGIGETGLDRRGQKEIDEPLTDERQLMRLNTMIGHIEDQFGPQGKLTTRPMACILYWQTSGPEFGFYEGGPGGGNNIRGPLTAARWAELAREGGGVLSGTPLSGSTYTFTAEATDDLGMTATGQFSVTVAHHGASKQLELVVEPAEPEPGEPTGWKQVSNIRGHGVWTSDSDILDVTYPQDWRPVDIPREHIRDPIVGDLLLSISETTRGNLGSITALRYDDIEGWHATVTYLQTIRGEDGEPGEPGVGAYRHYQVAASMTWTVTHNLGFRPSVFAVDSAGEWIIPGATRYLDDNTVELVFSASVGGEAYCS